LFAVFAGNKQSKQVRKCQNIEKFNLEVMKRFFKKPRVSVLVSNFKSRISFSEFLMKSRSQSFN